MYTYSGIGLFRASFFAEQQPGALPLAPIIREKSLKNLVGGQLYEGAWTDAGTIERIKQLEAQLVEQEL